METQELIMVYSCNLSRNHQFDFSFVTKKGDFKINFYTSYKRI